VTHLPIATILDGRYRLDALIAQGGFGAVYRGTHLPTGCDVAIKVLQPAFAARSVMGARFLREGQLLARLRHPNTVSIYELGIAGDSMFIAMELLRGETLYDRLARTGAFGWLQAVAVAQGVCAALSEAHAFGIVHRDLKPGNLHLEPWEGGEHVKVLDFGVAKLLKGSLLAAHHGDELTHFGQVLGTPEYMAPEQLLGDCIDRRADIYALGVVLYEMLTGRRPFDVGGNTAMLLLQMAHAPNRPSLVVRYAHGPIARELDRVVLRCLSPDPETRFQSIEELAAALDEVASRAAPTVASEHTVRTRFAAGTIIPEPAATDDAEQAFCDAPTDLAPDERTGRIALRGATRRGIAALSVRSR
jgi:serine/threonine-protein kinase